MSFKKLQHLLGNQLGIKPTTIKESDNFINDLNADSLDLVEIIMMVEKEFKIQITDCELSKCSTVGETLELIKNKSKI